MIAKKGGSATERQERHLFPTGFFMLIFLFVFVVFFFFSVNFGR